MKLTKIVLAFAVIFFIAGFFIAGFIKNNNHKKDIDQINNSKENISKLASKIKESATQQITPTNLPRFVHHNFIDLDKISKISKFRSGYGHDFSRGFNETESCRSMKHYLEPKGMDNHFWKTFHAGKTAGLDCPTVDYFAPVSGTIVDMRSAKNILGEEENKFILESDEYPNIWFNFFHIITSKDVKVGSKIKEGTFLGTISPGSDGEIAVTINPNNKEQLVSFFKLVDNKVFAEYKKRGVSTRDSLIISEESRDRNPLKCATEEPHRFVGSREIPDGGEEYGKWSTGPDNWVFLN